MGRYRIGLHQKEQRAKREEQIMKNRMIEGLDEELEKLDVERREKERLLIARQAQLKRLDSKV